MNYALRVQNGGNFAIVGAVQMVRLYHLEPLIEQGGAVYGYLCAHIPGGVLKRHLRSDIFQLSGVERAERTAAGRYNKAGKGRIEVTAQALPYGGMFAVHGQNGRALLFCKRHYHIPAAHKRFLVGESERLARIYGRKRVFKPRKTARRNKHYVRLFERGNRKSRLLAAAKMRFRGQRGYFFRRRTVRKRGIARLYLPELALEQLPRAARRHCNYFKLFGVLFNHLYRLSAYTARTAYERNFFHMHTLLSAENASAARCG